MLSPNAASQQRYHPYRRQGSYSYCHHTKLSPIPSSEEALSPTARQRYYQCHPLRKLLSLLPDKGVIPAILRRSSHHCRLTKVLSMPSSKETFIIFARRRYHPCHPPAELSSLPPAEGIIPVVPQQTNDNCRPTKVSFLLSPNKTLITAAPDKGIIPAISQQNSHHIRLKNASSMPSPDKTLIIFNPQQRYHPYCHLPKLSFMPPSIAC